MDLGLMSIIALRLQGNSESLQMIVVKILLVVNISLRSTCIQYRAHRSWIGTRKTLVES